MLDLVDSLPSHSLTNEAIVNDPEQVPLIVGRMRAAEAAQAKPEWRPDLAEWSLMHELLASIRDVLVQANSEQPSEAGLFPRPVTAVETHRADTEAEHVESTTRDIFAALTPWAVA